MDDAAWSVIRREVPRVLELRSQLAKDGWWNWVRLAGVSVLPSPPCACRTSRPSCLVHQWLDGWRGVGQVAEGMHRAGWDLQLTEYGDGHWRATFYVTGLAHSIVGGTAWEPKAWTAVQHAAWTVISKAL